MVIPSTVKYGMTELQVREIGDFAFVNCQNMTSVKMPDNIILIGQQAFSHCYSLTEIQLPASLYSIGDYAFE